ncbi:MAG TPA: hypothetical protein PKE12_06630 [Kiritimatiellia bacterium]|nr:hypothetical protein [Kiritimatiellia bacterium]
MRISGWMVVTGLLLGGAALADAEASDVRLIPGVPVEFNVSGVPSSMAQQLRRNTEPLRMSIKLPKDYDASRAYPVLVFLSGGDGGMGGEMHLADPFLGDHGYIVCNMPLFKRVVDSDPDEKKWSITPLDGPYALPALRMLLDELRRHVPKIDESRSVLAGFSNGAATAALILWAGDEDLIGRFGSFLLIEGGFWLGSDRDAESGAQFARSSFAGLAGKRVLVAYGEQATPADRVPWIRAARQTVAALQQAGIAVTEHVMPGIGHDFPADEMANVRRWLLAPP